MPSSTASRLTRKLAGLVLLSWVLAAPMVSAQPTPPDGGTAPARLDGEVDVETVEELIDTLESEPARQALVEDLRALVEVREQVEGDEEPSEELAEALQLDEVAQDWEQRYLQFLQDYGLNASLVGYLIATGLLVIATLIVLYLVRRLVRLGHHKLRLLAIRYRLHRRRIDFYMSILRLCAYVIIAVVFTGALAILWEWDIDRWFSGEMQLLVLQAAISIFTIFAIGAVIIEASDAAVDRFFHRRLGNQTARMNTLLPIARTILLLTLFTLFGLTLLSQLGLNVMPLLAGAGVVGFAVGFGAQALIKDVLNGFIIIVEDLVQVGDVAILGGKAGLVEKITIRKVQLRDLNGAVYTVPFSEISIVENLTKDFSYYLMEIGVAYREDTDRVVALLRVIDAEMRDEEAFRDKMLEPIEILGVDRFADSAVIIKARIMTPPLEQWGVGREFNRRMKQMFDKHNVEIPFPHRTLYFGENTDGTAPPMRLARVDAQSANDATPSQEPPA